MKKIITLIYGDGIGPEIIKSAKKIIRSTTDNITWEEHEAGEKVLKKGIASGITQEAINSIKRTKVLLKGPITTPIGYGQKSINVKLRKKFQTYANIRPVKILPNITCLVRKP